MYPLLETINTPADLRLLPRNQLPQLADELRQFLLESVSKTGGHLASNLGSIEITIALHYVFDTPNDRLVWDVGHQTYPHKILTNRRERMHSMRQHGGLAGFPKREESEFDTFGVGHSSTSIGAALGMAVAAKCQGIARKSIAVIGDGAMTAGMAFEALNNAGDMDVDLLVVLNDNDMSISPNVGALSHYFARLMSGRFYSAVKQGSNKVLGMVPPMRDIANKVEEHVKGMPRGRDLSSVLDTRMLMRANSFQMPVMLRIARVVATGMDIGRIIFMKILKKLAPSMRADSTRAVGIERMYSVARYTPVGRPAPMYTRRTASRVL